jgi:pimeloyl-ACP methyl ester carboxylesterase
MAERGIQSVAAALRARGLGVVRFNFLYREKGAGPPDSMPRLKQCLESVVAFVRKEIGPRRLLIGGRSMGGRAASMLASEGFGCDGLLLLAYPLHPAGKPEKLRDAHLPNIRVPVLPPAAPTPGCWTRWPRSVRAGWPVLLIRAAAARRFGLHSGAPVVLLEDDVHRLLEHRARRARLGGQPQRQFLRVHLEVSGQVFTAAPQGFALLENAGAHFGPARLLFHGIRPVR